MNKVELISVIANKMDISKAEAGRVLNTVMETIIEGVEAGECVLPGIGKLVLVDVPGRSGVSKVSGVEKAWKTEDHKKVKLRLSKAGKEIGN